jgi:hypothetical protein
MRMISIALLQVLTWLLLPFLKVRVWQAWWLRRMLLILLRLVKALSRLLPGGEDGMTSSSKSSRRAEVKKCRIPSAEREEMHARGRGMVIMIGWSGRKRLIESEIDSVYN